MKRSFLPALLAVLLAPIVILYLCQVIWLNSLLDPFPWLAGHLAAAGLFWLLFSGLSLTLYGFFRRPLLACVPGTIVMLVLTYISRIKMNINAAPLQLSDFSLVGGLGDIAGYASSQLMPSPAAWTAIALALLYLVLLGWLGRKSREKLPRQPGLLVGVFALTLLVSACFPGPMRVAALALNDPCRDQEDRNAELGVPLGLYAAWCQRAQVARDRNDLDSAALAAQFREELQEDRPDLALEETPDLIFVTSESFFDVTRLEGLTFAEDPLPVFHRLAETCTNGRFLSNTYGGGTGWVEMEMFTGLSMDLLKEGDTLSTLEEGTYPSLPTTVRLLEQLGYSTTAIHSHNNTLYNRNVIYPLIGFQEVLFLEDFLTPPETAGTYAADAVFAQEIIARYEARDPGKPCFLYGMSMENHQAYFAGKYPTHSGYPAQCEALTQEDQAILDSLVMGLHDADASLGTLVDYFSQVDRPVMLVFVGDHLPSLNLAAGDSLYQRLGILPPAGEASTAEAMAESLSTDYLVWTNYETEAQPDHTESCTFLGLHTLVRAGLPLNDYYQWMQDLLSPAALLTRNGLFVDETGLPTYEPSEEDQALLDRWGGLVWSLVYDSQTDTPTN